MCGLVVAYNLCNDYANLCKQLGSYIHERRRHNTSNSTSHSSLAGVRALPWSSDPTKLGVSSVLARDRAPAHRRKACLKASYLRKDKQFSSDFDGLTLLKAPCLKETLDRSCCTSGLTREQLKLEPVAVVLSRKSVYNLSAVVWEMWAIREAILTECPP